MGVAMTFKSERLIFRDFTESDFKLFYSVFSNSTVMKYALLDRFESEEELLPYFQNVLMNNITAEGRKVYEFAVYLASSDTFIGFADIEIQVLNRDGGCGEIGYFLLPEFWGNGYATETAKALTSICFEHLNLHRVSARCNANNVQSESVMKKAGMQKEGEFRKARYKDDRWENELHYCILIEEWEKGGHSKVENIP